MGSAACEKAIDNALRSGRALLKYISRNDLGLTGSHQYGYYLPINAWQTYTSNPPEKGTNSDSFVTVTWPDGRETESRIIWYGKDTRSEYRMTRFGRDFPWLSPDNLGSLLVLVPATLEHFYAYVLDLDEDIEDIQAALGVEVKHSYAVFDTNAQSLPLNEDDCIENQFRAFAQTVSSFPPTTVFANETLRVVENCIRNFRTLSADDRLVKCVDAEYDLFKIVERLVCQHDIVRLFKDVDDFLKTASTMMQRRKSRAGHSLENHVEYVLRSAGIPFDSQPMIDGRVKPDILIPSKKAYEDNSWPIEKLRIVGVKRTCKDRWRQVLSEANRIPQKHILTLQPGISTQQLQEMKDSNVTLIVPKSIQKEYPMNSPASIVTVEGFINSVRGII